MTDEHTPPQADTPIKGAGEKKPIPARFLIDVPKLPTPAPIDAEKALDLLQARAYSHAEKSNAPKEMREWIDRDTETIRAALKKGDK